MKFLLNFIQGISVAVIKISKTTSLWVRAESLKPTFKVLTQIISL